LLHQQVNSFREAIINQDAETPTQAQDLYNLLIAPLALDPETTPQLAIVPHGPLHYLPFAALRAPDETYLIQQYALTLLPSVSAIEILKDKAQEGQVGSLLALGNPDTAEAKPELPNAQAEAEAIAQFYNPAQVLTGPQATESMVQTQAEQFNFLHLAAHGFYDEFNPLNSTLYLAPDETNDGNLQVREIYNLKLKNAELVVLSACETQMGNVGNGDEVVGLSRAFFVAGAPTVVASLWSVPDAPTEQLMRYFYSYLKDPKTNKALALAKAQRKMIEELDNDNPAMWAAFVLSGDGGEISADVQSSLVQAEPIPAESGGLLGGWVKQNWLIIMVVTGVILAGLGALIVFGGGILWWRFGKKK
jgi:CHAT domain-containing protein